MDTSKSMTGSVAVTAATGNVSIKITDKDGNVVRTIDMGAQKRRQHRLYLGWQERQR